MKKALAYFRVSLTDALEYRGDIILYVLSGVALPVTSLLLWNAVSFSESSSPLSPPELVRYYIFLLFVGTWVSSWTSYFLSRDIRLGKISPWLVKPAPFLLYQASNNISEKMLKTVYLTPIAFLLSFIFKFTWPSLSPSKWLLFGLTFILAAVIFFLIDICLGLLAFWLDDSSAVREFYSILNLIFSGRLLPLYTLPLIIQNISFFLPFRYTLSLPLEIILDKLSSMQLIQGLIIQIIFLIISFCLYKFLWSRGVRKYSASGH